MPDTEQLQVFMYDEAKDAKYYADLAARRSSAAGGAVLRRLSREETGHLRRLQAEYFILTGQSYCPCVAEVSIPCAYLDALRDRWNEENESAAAYMAAAGATENTRLSSLYSELASDEARHADEMARLIAEAMC